MIIKSVVFEDFNEKELLSFIAENEQVQIIPLQLFKGEKHIIHSVKQGLKAFSQARNISKKQNIEFLLYFLSENQITKAFNMSKISRKSVFVCWADNCEKIFSNFKKKFKLKILKLPKINKEKEKKEIESTAVFSINS